MKNRNVKLSKRLKLLLVILAFTLLNFTPFTSKPNVLLADTKVTELLVAEDLIEIEEIEKIEEVDEIVEDINNEEDSIETPPLEVEEDEAQENKENSATIVEDEEKKVITDEKKDLELKSDDVLKNNEGLTTNQCNPGPHTQNGLLGEVVCNASQFNTAFSNTSNAAIYLVSDISLGGLDGSNRSQLTIESKENDSNHKYTFTVGSIQNIKSLTVRNLKIIETTSGPTSNLFTKGNLLTLEKVDYTGPPITLHITGGKPAIDIKITDSNIVIDKDQGAGEARNIDLYGTNNFHVRASGLFSVFRVSDNVILHENSVNTFDSNRRMFFSFSPTDYPTLLIKEGAEFHFIGGNVSYNVMEVRSIENNGLINIESAKTSNEIIESKGSITNNGDIIINNTGNATLIKANSFIQNTNLERPSTVNLYSSNGSFFSTGMKINTQQYNKWVDKPNYTFFSGTFAPSRENETIYKTKEFTLNKDTSKKHLSFGNIVYTDVMQDDREWVSFRTNPNACVQIKLDNSSSTTELFDCVNDFSNKPSDECVVKGVASDACYAKADASGIVKAKLPSKIANGEYGVKIIANNLLREDTIKYDVEGFLEIISVTENINFGNIKLSETPNTVYNRVDGNVINVEISDERSIQTGWVLSVYLKTPLSVVNSPTNTLSDSLIFKKGSKNDTIKIGFDNRLTIAETSGTYDSNQTLSFNENEGVLINIENYAKVLTSQPYTTELVWVLEAKEP